MEPRPHGEAWSLAGAGKGPKSRARAQTAIARSTFREGMAAAAAAAAGSGTPREEDAPGGDAAASQAQAPTNAPGGARLSRLPLARVKALVKADPDVTLAGQEAIFILARAAVRTGKQGRLGRGKGRGIQGRGAGGRGGPWYTLLTCLRPRKASVGPV